LLELAIIVAGGKNKGLAGQNKRENLSTNTGWQFAGTLPNEKVVVKKWGSDFT